MVLALHQALLETGHRPGEDFVGEDWTDRVKVCMNVQHPQAVKNWTDYGKSLRLWNLVPGKGRGNKSVITLLDGRRATKAILGSTAELAPS